MHSSFEEIELSLEIIINLFRIRRNLMPNYKLLNNQLVSKLTTGLTNLCLALLQRSKVSSRILSRVHPLKKKTWNLTSRFLNVILLQRKQILNIFLVLLLHHLPPKDTDNLNLLIYAVHLHPTVEKSMMQGRMLGTIILNLKVI